MSEYNRGFADGIRAALEEMSEIFEGVEDTDAWKEAFQDERV